MKKEIGILMADLSGYTALTEVHGDSAAMYIIKKYISIAQKSLVGKSRLLERAGDQLVIISEKADDLAKTATALVQDTATEPNFLGVHAGLHYGPVLEHKGNLFGSTINLTARIAARAKENKILCSQDFIDALLTPEEFMMIPQGQINFKNVLESKMIFELRTVKWRQESDRLIDPICQMHLEEHDRTISLIDGDKEHFFCSTDCKELYLQYHINQTQVVA